MLFQASTRPVLLLVALLVAAVTSSSDPRSGCFRASVIDYVTIGADELVDESDVLKNVRKNLQEYEKAACAASADGADIIVFPELGIFNSQRSTNPDLTLRQVVRRFSADIPDPRKEVVKPCTDPEFQDEEILRRLSCIARDNRIYLVTHYSDVKECGSGAHDCRPDGVKIYNTQIAFDRQGNLVARYHKYHLYGELQLDPPDLQELVFFDTDFGARIGLYVCFDRLFHDPLIPLIKEHNVTTLALSTWWFDEYPFLMSHQIDDSWSKALGVNILTANIKQPWSGSTGAGVFPPGFRTASYTHAAATKTGSSAHSVQVIANAPLDPASSTACDPNVRLVEHRHESEAAAKPFRAFYTDFSEMVTRPIVEAEARGEQVCDGDFCCTFDYKTATAPGPSLVMGAKNRRRKGYYECAYPTYEQACFVLAYDRESSLYLNQSAVLFEDLKIRGAFETEYQFASALANDFALVSPLDMSVQTDHLQVQHDQPIIFAGIFGRVYDRDPPYVRQDCGNHDTGSVSA